MLQSQEKYPEDYKDTVYSNSMQAKKEHFEAEKQDTQMANMPPHLVPKYSELFMQLGWILFFSQVFPAAGFFTIVAGLIRMNIELRGMS